MNSAISLLGRSPTPTSSRSRSSSHAGIEVVDSTEPDEESRSGNNKTPHSYNSASPDTEQKMDYTEESPLLGQKPFGEVSTSGWTYYPKRISSGMIGTVRVVMMTMTAPVRYLIACFFDDEGHFSLLNPVITITRVLNPRKRRRGAQSGAMAVERAVPGLSQEGNTKTRGSRRSLQAPPTISASSAVYSDSELDEKHGEGDSPARHTRSRSNFSTDGDEIAPQRRSIRIKLHNEEALKKRRKQQAEDARTKASDAKDLVAASLKSPSSPLSSSSLKLTKFPRAPQPPRPLIPRRQPSYAKASPNDLKPRQKTLVIDLDETLIHSQSKGGRFATGHMIEVKMSHSVGVGGVTLGPQVPILYYVHKRPHCDEFLRKVRLSAIAS
jgi:CTD nuclear envelope phosphatase 1